MKLSQFLWFIAYSLLVLVVAAALRVVIGLRIQVGELKHEIRAHVERDHDEVLL